MFFTSQVFVGLVSRPGLAGPSALRLHAVRLPGRGGVLSEGLIVEGDAL